MHREAAEWTYIQFHEWRNVQSFSKFDILEIGSLNINGGVRHFFEPWIDTYTGIDVQEGPGVDVVANATEYSNPEFYDIIVTNETFEHTRDWREIIQRSYKNLSPTNGLFIATMAGEGRPVHSAIDTGQIRDWEHYANIGAWDLNKTLKDCGFTNIVVNTLGWDLRCKAEKQ